MMAGVCANRGSYLPERRGTNIGFRLAFYQPPVDSISPELGLFGDLSTTLEGGSEWIEPGYVAYDIRDGNLTDQVTISGNLNVSVTGQYELTYEITDAAGNTANATRVVEVMDTLLR